MLNVVIGLVFILLLLSLLATTVMEIISALFALRGKNLEKALKNMLAGESPEVLEAFKENTIYKQLAGKFYGKRTPPSYMSSKNFRSILMNVVGGVDNLEENLEKIPDGNLKDTFHHLLQDAEYNLDNFGSKVEGWYDDVMDRASGWYKRHIKKILIFVGLIIAVTFNADTVAIYNKLAKDPKASLEVAAMAREYTSSEEERGRGLGMEGSQSIVSLQSEINTLVSSEVKDLNDPLGIGWENFAYQSAGWYDWMKKILGWLVTALAISLGAPFWFDLLKRMVSIRASGPAPSTTQPAPMPTSYYRPPKFMKKPEKEEEEKE